MNHKAGVAPAILRRHPGLDQGQLELIGHLDGPARGIAGPGTGKTLAVALRGINILLQGLASPEELVLCTYSRAAARELRQRFIALATDAGYMGDLSRVRIGTIHGLCRRILSSHARRAGLRPDLCGVERGWAVAPSVAALWRRLRPRPGRSWTRGLALA